jgi:ABC-type Fe3+/spermidine/putrescine transport system ATPase subunit
MGEGRAAALRVSGLEIVYPDFCLEGAFEIGPGERVALTGPSGIGKTTLLRWLAGLDAAGQGALKLGDRELAGLPPERRDFGVVFQEGALFGARTVLENAAFGLEVRGVGRAEREARARSWLERIGLGSRIGARAGDLSGGERQRVALVRALVWEPRALLLDEPFSALDPVRRDEARALLRDWLASHPVPTLFVTHDEADRRALATRTLAIEPDPADPARRRKIVASGSP